MATVEELSPGPVSGLLRGTRVLVRCLVPPVVNQKEGVCLWEAGEAAEVVLSGYWEGLLAQRKLVVVEVLEEEPGEDPQLPSPPRKPNGHKSGCRCPICKRWAGERV